MDGHTKARMAMVERLQGIGVDEIACLVDFGVAQEDMLESLGLLGSTNPVSNQLENIRRW